jgi:hypothetical protein
MIMKRNLWAMIAALLFVSVSALGTRASANDTVNLNIQFGISDDLTGPGELGGYGGEFTAITGDYSLPTSLGQTAGEANLAALGYVDTSSASTISVANNEYGFDTFCLQQTVDVYNNTTNYYSIPSNNEFSTDDIAPDESLTVGAAWLYREFATGNLAGYNYGAGRSTSDEQLQNAIWYLQGEPLYNGFNFTTDIDPFLTLVSTHFNSLALAEAGTTGPDEYGVGVMALTTGDDGTGPPLQDQLILIPQTASPNGPGSPVPDGGSTVCMLGAALAAIFLLGKTSGLRLPGQ